MARKSDSTGEARGSGNHGGSGGTGSGGSRDYEWRCVHVISEQPFFDSLALLVLLCQFPNVVLALVHLWHVFIRQGRLISPRSLPHLFMHLFAPIQTKNQAAGGSQKWIIIDMVLSVFLLQCARGGYQFVVTFASAVVASSMAGGRSPFANAIYATSAVAMFQFFWKQFGMLLFPQYAAWGQQDHSPVWDVVFDVIDNQVLYRRMPELKGMLYRVSPSAQILHFVTDIPVVISQALALHVIGLGFVPFFQKLFLSTVKPTGTASEPSTHTSPSVPIIPLPSINFDSLDPVTLTVPDGVSNEHSRDDYLRNYDFSFPASSFKQSKKFTAVRAAQPLWTGLASSIILAARHDSFGDDDFIQQAGPCILKYVFDRAFVFEIMCDDPPANDKYSLSVTVNGVLWPQVNATCSEENNSFFLFVDGLTPYSEYAVEIACGETVLFKHGVKTEYSERLKATSGRSRANSVGNPGPPSLGSSVPARPVSPVTTLLESLTTAQMTLSEEKSKTKKLRKDHSKRLASIRQEIENTKSKMESNLKQDSKSRHKIDQLRLSLPALDEELAMKQSEFEELNETVAGVSAAHKAKKKDFEERQQQLTKLEKEAQKLKKEADEKEASFQQEIVQLKSKLDRLQGRRAKAANDVSRVEREIRGELDGCLQRLMAERGKRQAKRQAMENEFSSNINKMAKGVENLRQEASIIQQMMSGSAPNLNHSTSHPHMEVNPSTYYASSASLPMFRGD
ncbi:Protein NNF2 [Yarrowia sp. B02]|nr:Protein NNF2 [Yarrowia sp. B02]